MPRLDDDGHTVTLDLHGALVEDALALTVRLVREAARRGRTTVKLVHGHSTSSRLYQNRSIKHALHDLLDRGTLRNVVVHAWRAEGAVLIDRAAGRCVRAPCSRRGSPSRPAPLRRSSGR